jgi:hypothetical protein
MVVSTVLEVFMTLVMVVSPIRKTNIAKIVSAATHHMVAAVNFLDENLATGTSLVIAENVLKVSVAGAGVLGELTILAEAHLAPRALEPREGGVKYTFAVLAGTETQIRVFDGEQPP